MLYIYVSYTTRPFLNNIAIKGLKTRYNDAKIKPSLRRFVVKHLINLDNVLANIERA